MPIKFYPINLILIGLIMLPNILSLIFPPVHIPQQPPRPSYWTIVIVTEWIGRLGIMILPLFWKIKFDKSNAVFLILAGLMLALYYVCWMRFFLTGREFITQFSPLFGIPVPLAIFPLLSVLFVGIAQGSWPVIAAAVIMSAGHIPESLMTYYSSH